MKELCSTQNGLGGAQTVLRQHGPGHCRFSAVPMWAYPGFRTGENAEKAKEQALPKLKKGKRIQIGEEE
jgi:hypothetical protein